MPAKKAAPAKKVAKKAAKADQKDKPKRPLNAYMLFANAKRAEVKKAHPSFSITEIAKEIGAMWKKLSDAQKAAYKK